jgi:hypothetical protein
LEHLYYIAILKIVNPSINSPSTVLRIRFARVFDSEVALFKSLRAPQSLERQTRGG